MAKAFLILIITFSIAQTLNSTEIYGVPKIIDGDTVHINNKKIRLEGIDAPEIKQQCKKPFLKVSAIIGFEFNKNYSCGVTAKKKLIDKIDIIFYSKVIINEKNLIIPHEYMHERNFVLHPLNDIASDFVHPIINNTVNKIMKECNDKNEIKLYKI